MEHKEIYESALKDFDELCNNLLIFFCERHDFEYNPIDVRWIGDEPGGMAEVGDYFFTLSQIVTDLKMQPETNEIFDWYDYDLRCGEYGVSSVNYESWLKGCPRHPESFFIELDNLQENIHRAEEQLKNAVEEANKKKF